MTTKTVAHVSGNVVKEMEETEVAGSVNLKVVAIKTVSIMFTSAICTFSYIFYQRPLRADLSHTARYRNDVLVYQLTCPRFQPLLLLILFKLLFDKTDFQMPNVLLGKIPPTDRRPPRAVPFLFVRLLSRPKIKKYLQYRARLMSINELATVSLLCAL